LNLAAKIGMSGEFWRWPESRKADERDLKPRVPGMLHGRNAVGIVRGYSNHVNGAICGEICDVDAE
jgi:hypothetical protein